MVAVSGLRFLISLLWISSAPDFALGRTITALCRFSFGYVKVLSLLLLQHEFSKAKTSIHPVNRVLLDCHCPISSDMEFATMSGFSLILSGFISGNIWLKTTFTTVSVFSKGSTKWRFIASVFVIVKCVLDAASFSGC